VVIYHIFDVESARLLSQSGVKTLYFCSNIALAISSFPINC